MTPRRTPQRPRRDWPPAELQPDWQDLFGEPQARPTKGWQLLLPLVGVDRGGVACGDYEPIGESANV